MEEITFFSSISMPGICATSEPVAMTTVLASSVWASPVSGVTSTLPGAVMRPSPWMASISFFFRRNATPWVLPFTPSSLKAIMVFRSSCGFTLMPIPAKPWPASS